MSVLIRMRCNSKKQITGYNKKLDGSMQLVHEIEFQVAYASGPEDPNYIFSQVSGGSNFKLSTVNDEAAAQYEVGKDYDFLSNISEKQI